MYYLCDYSNPQRLGVKDTSDGTVEYYTPSELKAFKKQGIYIAGVSSAQKVALNDTNCFKYYAGDTIAPPSWSGIVMSTSSKNLPSYKIVTRTGLSVAELTDVYIKNCVVNGNYAKFKWSNACLSTRNKVEYLRHKPAKNIIPSSALLITNKRALQESNKLYSNDLPYENISEGNLFDTDTVRGKYFCILSKFNSDRDEFGIYFYLLDLTSPYGWYTCHSLNDVLTKLDTDPNAICNLTLNGDVIEFTGLNGTVRIDLRIVNKYSGNTPDEKSKYNYVKTKLVNEYASLMDNNKVLQVLGINSNGVAIVPEGCVCFANPTVESAGAPLKRLVLPKSLVADSYEVGLFHLDHFTQNKAFTLESHIENIRYLRNVLKNLWSADLEYDYDLSYLPSLFTCLLDHQVKMDESKSVKKEQDKFISSFPWGRVVEKDFGADVLQGLESYIKMICKISEFKSGSLTKDSFSTKLGLDGLKCAWRVSQLLVAQGGMYKSKFSYIYDLCNKNIENI